MRLQEEKFLLGFKFMEETFELLIFGNILLIIIKMIKKISLSIHGLKNIQYLFCQNSSRSEGHQPNA